MISAKENCVPTDAQEQPVAGDPVEDMFAVGKKLFIRCVTHYTVGRVLAVRRFPVPYVILGDASWVAETKRFGDTLAKGELKESEPFYRPVGVFLGAGVDVTEWPHPLPRTAISSS